MKIGLNDFKGVGFMRHACFEQVEGLIVCYNFNPLKIGEKGGLGKFLPINISLTHLDFSVSFFAITCPILPEFN